MKLNHSVIVILLLLTTTCNSIESEPGDSNIQEASTSKEIRFDYNETIRGIEFYERSKPKTFLEGKVSHSTGKNFFGEEEEVSDINLIISNNAKVAVFKQIKIKLIYESKGSELLKEEILTVSDHCYPLKNLEKNLRVVLPKGTNNISVVIEGASHEPLPN